MPGHCEAVMDAMAGLGRARLHIFVLSCNVQWLQCVLQAQVSQLATYLGEKPEADPAALFGLRWDFACAFDEAYAGIAAADDS